MRKMIKKASVILSGVILTGALAACAKFDASDYVKAILDNAYYNDATGIVAEKIGSAEEAAHIYEHGIDAQLDAMLGEVALPEGLTAEYRQFYEDLYSSAKYTVGEAVEVDDETIEVTITYEKMNLFEGAVADYEKELAVLVNGWTDAALAGETVPTDEEMNEQLFIVWKDCLIKGLENAAYEEAATSVIRVNLIDNVWTPNEEDLLNLEYSLFDFEKLYGVGTE